jgi:hypothetical protein
MRCSVCLSPDRAVLDKCLTLGLPLRKIAGRTAEGREIGRSALHRHSVTCLRLAPPGDRVRALADRDTLSAVAADTLTRAQEFLDDAEVRRDGRAITAGLAAVGRALDTAARLLPAPVSGADDPEVRALLLTLAEDVDDLDVHAVIVAGMRERGADNLADALSATWERQTRARAAALADHEDRRAALAGTSPTREPVAEVAS